MDIDPFPRRKQRDEEGGRVLDPLQPRRRQPVVRHPAATTTWRFSGTTTRTIVVRMMDRPGIGLPLAAAVGTIVGQHRRGAPIAGLLGLPADVTERSGRGQRPGPRRRRCRRGCGKMPGEKRDCALAISPKCPVTRSVRQPAGSRRRCRRAATGRQFDAPRKGLPD